LTSASVADTFWSFASPSIHSNEIEQAEDLIAQLVVLLLALVLELRVGDFGWPSAGFACAFCGGGDALGEVGGFGTRVGEPADLAATFIQWS
jgi:hypothetical protein